MSSDGREPTRAHLPEAGDDFARIAAGELHGVFTQAVEAVGEGCHLSMLARYREPLQPTESIRLRLGLLEAARFVIDAAMDALDEIRFDVRASEGAGIGTR